MHVGLSFLFWVRSASLLCSLINVLSKTYAHYLVAWELYFYHFENYTFTKEYTKTLQKCWFFWRNRNSVELPGIITRTFLFLFHYRSDWFLTNNLKNNKYTNKEWSAHHHHHSIIIQIQWRVTWIIFTKKINLFAMKKYPNMQIF